MANSQATAALFRNIAVESSFLAVNFRRPLHFPVTNKRSYCSCSVIGSSVDPTLRRLMHFEGGIVCVRGTRPTPYLLTWDRLGSQRRLATFRCTPPLLSQSGGGLLNRFRGKFEQRAEARKADQMKDLLERLSQTERWTLTNFAAELDSSMSHWTTKIPGMGYTKEVKAVKESRKIVNAMLSNFGADATPEQLARICRRDKVCLCY